MTDIDRILLESDRMLDRVSRIRELMLEHVLLIRQLSAQERE